MIAVKNVRKSLAILVALLMAVTAFAVVSYSEDSNAAVGINGSDISDSGFKEDSSGTLKISVNNNEGDVATIWVTVKEDSKTYVDSEEFTVENGISTVKVKFKLNDGKHTLDIEVYDGTNTSSQQYYIDVDENVWSNISTYVAVILIAILVLIIALVYMRANPRTKPTTTFTQLEQEKKTSFTQLEAEKKAGTTEKKQYKSSSEDSDKIKYTSSRRK